MQSKCHGECGFCLGKDIMSESSLDARQKCQAFKQLKAQISRESYLEVKLQQAEAAGFSSAGVLLFRRRGEDIDLLLSREKR